MLAWMHVSLPGHVHSARSAQPEGHVSWVSGRGRPSRQADARLTAVVLVAVVVTVQVSVAAFPRQDAASRATLEVAGGALCYHGNALEATGSGNVSAGDGGSVLTVHSRLRQETGDVPPLLWELGAVGVLGPLKAHHAQNRLTLGLGGPAQRPGGRGRAR